MATLLWPLGLVVSTQVLVNKNPPPANKRPEKRNLEQILDRSAKNSMGHKMRGKNHKTRRERKEMENKKLVHHNYNRWLEMGM